MKLENNNLNKNRSGVKSGAKNNKKLQIEVSYDLAIELLDWGLIEDFIVKENANPNAKTQKGEYILSHAAGAEISYLIMHVTSPMYLNNNRLDQELINEMFQISCMRNNYYGVSNTAHLVNDINVLKKGLENSRKLNPITSLTPKIDEEKTRSIMLKFIEDDFVSNFYKAGNAPHNDNSANQDENLIIDKKCTKESQYCNTIKTVSYKDAIKFSYFNLCREFIESGANPSAISGHDLLLSAVGRGNIEFIKYMTSDPVISRVSQRHISTALKHAACSSYYEIVDHLISFVNDKKDIVSALNVIGNHKRSINQDHQYQEDVCSIVNNRIKEISLLKNNSDDSNVFGR